MSWANPTPEKVFFFSPSRHRKPLTLATTLNPKKPPHPSSNSLQSLQDTTLENEQPDGKVDENGAVASKNKQRHLTVEHQAYWSPVMAPRVSGPSKPKSAVHHKNHHLVASAAARARTEVLDLSHDPYRSFVVHFDDPHWRNYSNNLKPLGLNILLNSCNLHAEYIRFIDHVHAISAVVPRTIAVVNRRCKYFLHFCFISIYISFFRLVLFC